MTVEKKSDKIYFTFLNIKEKYQQIKISLIENHCDIAHSLKAHK